MRRGRGPGYFSEIDGHLSNMFSPVVKWLTYICVGVFLIQVLGAFDYVIIYLGAHANTAIYHGFVWQFITYAFVHGNFAHVFFNLFSLYMFGTRLERRWGSATFLRFVLVVCIGAVATHMVVTMLLGRPYEIIIGISGVVYGILLAYAFYYPDDIIYFQFLLPIKVKYFVAILGLMTLLASFQTGSHIAHLTHLGGLVFGYLFIKFPAIFDRIPLPSFRRRFRRQRGPQRWQDFD